MSYCRWGTDDYQCDVYVYEGGGWITHVAGNRVTPSGPRPPDIGDWWRRGPEGVAAYMQRDEAVQAWLATGERKAIGLPHDGESFCDSTPGECADRLESLRALGYNVPQHAIDSLRTEQAESDEPAVLTGKAGKE